jgi:hypothetical protein
MDTIKTKNYKLFKIIIGNREIIQTHVDKLADSISQRNLLELNPIDVNTEFEVVDGQHRLKAAEKLGVSIYYRQSSEIKVEDMIILNLTKKTWSHVDYLNYYCEHMNLPEYIKLKDFMRKEKVSLNLSLGLFGCSRGMSSKEFKKGNFIMPMDLSIMVVLPQCRAIIEYIRSINGNLLFIKSNTFLKSLTVFLSTDGVVFKKFMEALPKHVSRLTPQTNLKNYLERWTQIYNWGKKKMVEVKNED